MAQPRADDVAEPLRLAADEATALLVAARAVSTLPGLREGDRQALLRATAKLEAAAGEAAGASSRLSVTFESEGGVFADVDRAISERRRLWIRYYSPARDELTEREVDPIRLFAVGPHVRGGLVPPLRGAPYLPARPGRRDQAAGRAVGAARDRTAGTCRRRWCSPPPRTPRSSSRSAPAAAGSRSTTRMTVRTSLPDGGLRITLRTPDPDLAEAAGAAARRGRPDRRRRATWPTARGRRPVRRSRRTTG